MGREINGKSPTAQRMLKFAFNLIDDGLVGQQLFAGEATRLAYMTDEAERAGTRSSRSVRPTGPIFRSITEFSCPLTALCRWPLRSQDPWPRIFGVPIPRSA